MTTRDSLVLRDPQLMPFGSLAPQENKWGLEARIYFDGPALVVESLRGLGYHVEDRAGGGYKSDYRYRINSQTLFWKLVRHGYRLGENRPIGPT
jgi:hypothetical protein